ncbi:hypothetical protein JX265_011893 [Neoarthrinium moseri]|uniref:Uncharacterized protein n=1 Tax=Neoarthrinium moseri TaxID=1658444 RepID=A0A9P9WBF2_9PEZI|nr:hypothetical protein JX265_011893 [Neoarthrinium moseri]
MLFSTRGPLAVALAASSLVAATPNAVAPAEPRTLDLALPDLGDLSKPFTEHINLDTDLSGLTLVEGVLVDAVVPPLAAAHADVDLAVKCHDCFVRGDINATVSLASLVPALSLSLSDVEAQLDLELYVGVATTVAVNLYAPVAPIELPIAGLKVSALVYVDLVLSLDAAIDVTAGIYVRLTEDALIEIDILKGELLNTEFTGLAVKTLPIEVRIGCAKLQAALRVRVQAGVEAELDLNDLLPLGLDIPEIGAGVELGVYANIVEYVGFLCDTPSCPVSKESYGVNIGAAVELDVEVGDLIDLSLAPTVSLGLLTLPTATHCSQSGGHTYSTLPPTASASASVSVPTIGSPAGSLVGEGGASGKPTASVTGSTPAHVTSSNEAATGTGKPTGTGLVTSTLTSTATYVVTACAAEVVNCPAGYQTTETLIKTTMYTTVCPATASITAFPSTTSSAAPKPTSSDVTVVTQVTTLVPCSSVATFTPPAGVSTYPPKSASSTVATATATHPAGGNTGNYPTGSVSYPAGGKETATHPAGGASTSTVTKPSETATYPVGGKETATYPAGGASTSPVTKPSETGTYPAGGASTSPVTKPSETATYPAGGKETATYPAGGKETATYPAGGASTYPGSASYPASSATKPAGYPVPSSEAPYPTYPAGGKPGSGYGNSTVPYPTGMVTSSYKPSASVVYPTTKSSSYPAGTPSSTPVAAGAGKIGSGVAGALAVAALVAMI